MYISTSQDALTTSWKVESAMCSRRIIMIMTSIGFSSLRSSTVLQGEGKLTQLCPMWRRAIDAAQPEKAPAFSVSAVIHAKKQHPYHESKLYTTSRVL